MWHAWGNGEVFTGFWLGGLKLRDQWEDLGMGRRITFKVDLRDIRIDGVNCIWLVRIGFSGGLLLTH
jgi:hypothetical protein